MFTGNHSAIWIAASNHSAMWIAGSIAIDFVTVYIDGSEDYSELELAVTDSHHNNM